MDLKAYLESPEFQKIKSYHPDVEIIELLIGTGGFEPPTP